MTGSINTDMHAYRSWTATWSVQLVTVKHVLGNVQWCLDVTVELIDTEGSTVPRLLTVVLCTVLVHIGVVQTVQPLTSEIGEVVVQPIYEAHNRREVPTSPGVPNYSGPADLFGHKVDIVESSDTSSRTSRENNVCSTTQSIQEGTESSEYVQMYNIKCKHVSTNGIQWKKGKHSLQSIQEGQVV